MEHPRENAGRLADVDMVGLERRIRNRAARLARLLELKIAPPTCIVVAEKRLLDEAFTEWCRRMAAEGAWLGKLDG